MAAASKNPIFLLAVSILLGITGQFLFKAGLNRMQCKIDLCPSMVLIFFKPWIMAGLACYVASTFTWLAALSRVPLSFAYPLLSSGYLIIFIVSVLFLGEEYSHSKLIANFLIIMGIVLLFWGKK